LNWMGLKSAMPLLGFTTTGGIERKDRISLTKVLDCYIPRAENRART
jgi:hypothetical protein